VIHGNLGKRSDWMELPQYFKLISLFYRLGLRFRRRISNKPGKKGIISISQPWAVIPGFLR
jgi:hypothetical protein